MQYRAYSPGSVTLFFQVVDSEVPYLKGSKGVSVCIAPGALTELDDNGSAVFVNGKEVSGEIQKYIAQKYGFKGTIKTTTYLPISQGFGISGAIALSTSLAMAAKYKKTYYYAVKIAHEAELFAGSGLGDVASEYEGGFTYRRKAGVQPYGHVDRVHYSGKISVAVFGEKIETKSVLENEELKRRIKEAGAIVIKKFDAAPTFSNALKLARDFSFSLGLMSAELEKFLGSCPNATMAMLGNSAIIFGDCNVPSGAKVYDVTLSGRASILD